MIKKICVAKFFFWPKVNKNNHLTSKKEMHNFAYSKSCSWWNSKLKKLFIIRTKKQIERKKVENNFWINDIFLYQINSFFYYFFLCFIDIHEALFNSRQLLKWCHALFKQRVIKNLILTYTYMFLYLPWTRLNMSHRFNYSTLNGGAWIYRHLNNKRNKLKGRKVEKEINY